MGKRKCVLRRIVIIGSLRMACNGWDPGLVLPHGSYSCAQSLRRTKLVCVTVRLLQKWWCSSPETGLSVTLSWLVPGVPLFLHCPRPSLSPSSFLPLSIFHNFLWGEPCHKWTMWQGTETSYQSFMNGLGSASCSPNGSSTDGRDWYSQHLDRSLMANLEPEAPNEDLPRFVAHRDHEMSLFKKITLEAQ